jgi:hypothetical protein
VRKGAGLNNAWHGYLPCDLVEVMEGLVGLEFQQGVGLAGGCSTAAAGACALAHRWLVQGN